MSVYEYAAAFTEKINLVPYHVPSEISMVNKFFSGLPKDFGQILKVETNLKAAIWATRNVESQIREKGLEKAKK